MDLQANKTDAIIKPITQTRISASEWNQLVASCMEFITQAGLTPDANDPEQFLNAFKIIAENLSLLGANTNLSNLTATGESHFANPALGNISNAGKQIIVNNMMPDYANGVSVSGVTRATYTQVQKDSFVVCYTTDNYAEDYKVYVSPDNGSTKYLVGYRFDDTNIDTQGTSFTFFVPKGWYFTNEAENDYNAEIYPLKGAQ